MSDEQPVRRGRKPRITVSPRSDAESFNPDDVIAKRLAGNPFGARTTAIPLAEPGRWATFIANSLADENNHYRMVHELGWVPLTIHDLAPGTNPQSIGWQVKEDGITLCRGARGDEIAYKMDKRVREQIQLAKTAENKRGIGSAKALKESAANAAAGQMGSEAADFVHKHLHVTGSDREGPLGAA
jgi:hypothetical protein